MSARYIRDPVNAIGKLLGIYTTIPGNRKWYPQFPPQFTSQEKHPFAGSFSSAAFDCVPYRAWHRSGGVY